MKNMVPCKRCKVDFNYSPGFAGNARQYCDECRGQLDNEEIDEFIESLIKEENKLNQEKYDPVDVLVDGNIPEFNSDLERFLCAREMAFFIRKTGMTGMEENLIKLFDVLDDVHVALLLKQQNLDTLMAMSKDERFKEVIERSMKWV